MPSDARADGLIMDLAFAESPFAQAIHDQDLVCLAINDRMCEMFGLAADALRGRRLTDVLHGHQYDAMERCMRQVLGSGRPEQRETYRRVPGEARERAWSVIVSPLKGPGGRTRAVWVGVLDTTEQHWGRQRLMLLNEASTHIGTTLDVTKTADELAGLVVPRLADLAVVDLLDSVLSGDEPASGPLIGTVKLRRTAHQSVLGDPPDEVIRIGDVETHPEASPTAQCLATGKSIVTGADDPEFASWVGRNEARAKAVRKYGAHSVLCVPIRARGVTLGVAVFLRAQRPEQFDQDDVLLAEELTGRAAVSLDNARRYNSERTTALALQRSLLPKRLPRQSAVEAASRYLPASGHAGVGGDWFDVIPLSGARVALAVGDVVGHDLQASATMGRLRAAVRTLADVDVPPDELITRLDDLVSRMSAETGLAGDEVNRDVYATCLYAVYDPVSRRCSLASAGHPVPALVTPDGDVSFLEIPVGPPLGLGGLPFEGTEVELQAGSTLVLYTDGLIESRDNDPEDGQDRLRQALGRKEESSLEEACDHLLADMLPERFGDDVALLMARTRALTDDQVATWDLPADPAVVTSAREQALTRLADWGLDDAAFTTELVISELVTNAIRHARSPIQLRLIRDRTLICEVSDGSSTAPHPRRAREFDEGGRGLLLVSQLTERWGSRQTPHGKTIWTEQPLLPALGSPRLALARPASPWLVPPGDNSKKRRSGRWGGWWAVGRKGGWWWCARGAVDLVGVGEL
ncbi:MAG TPA: SpoIIE family protein phosphatase [Trebonia sp.]|nr:SpoIIE family protein phosphatase [Trebonia sp.]